MQPHKNGSLYLTLFYLIFLLIELTKQTEFPMMWDKYKPGGGWGRGASGVGTHLHSLIVEQRINSCVACFIVSFVHLDAKLSPECRDTCMMARVLSLVRFNQSVTIFYRLHKKSLGYLGTCQEITIQTYKQNQKSKYIFLPPLSNKNGENCVRW